MGLIFGEGYHPYKSGSWNKKYPLAKSSPKSVHRRNLRLTPENIRFLESLGYHVVNSSSV